METTCVWTTERGSFAASFDLSGLILAHGIPFVTFVNRGIVFESVALIALCVNRVVTIEFSRMIEAEPDNQHRSRSVDATSSLTQLFLRSVAWQCPLSYCHRNALPFSSRTAKRCVDRRLCSTWGSCCDDYRLSGMPVRSHLQRGRQS